MYRLTFIVNNINDLRRLLKDEFQSVYKEFDAAAVSHSMAPIKTRTPIWLVWAINDFLSICPDDFLEQTAKDYQAAGNPNGLVARDFLHYLLRTDAFEKQAMATIKNYLELVEDPKDLWSNSIFDCYANKLYTISNGDMDGLVRSIVKHYDHLKTDEEREAFIANDLIRVNETETTNASGITRIFEFHIRPLIDDRFLNFNLALSTADSGERFFSYGFTSDGSHDPSPVYNESNLERIATDFATYGCFDDLKSFAEKRSDCQELLNLIETAENKATDAYDCTLLTISKDGITDRPLLY